MKLLHLSRTLLAFVVLTLFSVGGQASTVFINMLTGNPGDIHCANSPSDPDANCWTAHTVGKGSVNERNFLVDNVGTPTILAAFEAGVPGFADLTELYKADSYPETDTGDPVPPLRAEPAAESGPLNSSYGTVFEFTTSDDYIGATITYDPTGGPAVDCSIECYLLVKDGNHSPAAYLFDLALGSAWDGEMDLVLKNFWLGNGSISHVALYGNISAVPAPAAFWLFGTALLGFIGISRSTRV